ncbi:hypothetical protein F3G60_34905, partial [Pseudomonas aeruginosa]
GVCNAKNCTQLGRPVPCVKINPKNCKKGCICKEGYLRDENGLCVPEQSCPRAYMLLLIAHSSSSSSVHSRPLLGIGLSQSTPMNTVSPQGHRIA